MVSEGEIAVFKKKLKLLKQFKGKGTELISLYLPPKADRSSITSQLTDEKSQSSNIKSPTTRKNVQGALRKIQGFLKRINFKYPKNGLVVFSGNVSEQEGKSDIKLFTVKPLQELKTKLYWCDSEFHLTPIEEMIKPQEVFALIAMDKREATFATLIGKKYEIIARFTSNVPGKTRAGGQSSQRFERLRSEAAEDFYKRISEKTNQILLPFGKKLKGIIVGGPGATKNYFLNKDLIDYRLKKKLLGTVDISYTDESGIREIFQKSQELLKESEFMIEKETVKEFLGEIVKSGLAIYGQMEVEEALKLGKVKTLLISEDLDWWIFKFECSCGKKFELLVKDLLNFNKAKIKCPNCGNKKIVVLEEIDFLDFLLEKANEIGAEVKIVSTDSEEGKQFFEGFGGIGAILRYK